MSGCGAEPGLISVDQALALIIEQTRPLSTQTCALHSALHRYLAADVHSRINLPLFTQSAVDGYALCADALTSENTRFENVGEIRAGENSAIELKKGQAARIFTGAKIPLGATTVARQEIVNLDGSNIILTAALDLNTDIRIAGEEVAEGQLLASAGQQLGVGGIAALSMAGIRQVEVYTYPRVAVIITGDEILKANDTLETGKIFDANAPLIQAWFKNIGQTVKLYHVLDSAQALQTLLQQLSREYDVILTTGGVSVGDYDFIRPVALDVGYKQIFWKVKQKPGKPMFFARFEQAEQCCYLLGLPGNPAAVYVGMYIYTQTLLNALQGQRQLPDWFQAELSQDIKPDARERFLRMSASFAHATVKVTNLSKQQSHMLSNLMQANCLVRIPAGQSLTQGQTVQGIFID